MTETSLGKERTAEFVELFSQNAQRLSAYILTLLHHHPAADDVFQETSRIAWEKFDSYTTGTSFLAWVRRIAYYRVLNFRQQQKKNPVAFSDSFVDMLDSEVAASSDPLDAEMKALANCYRQLEDPYRKVIDLRYSGGLKVRELAERIKKPLSTVYRYLDKAHELLLNCIQRRIEEAV